MWSLLLVCAAPQVGWAAPIEGAADHGAPSDVPSDPPASPDSSVPPDSPAPSATETPTGTEAPAPAATGADTDAQAAARDQSLIVVQAPQTPPGVDPLSAVNEKSYALVQTTDKLVVAPVAYAYRSGLPKPLRDGIHNVLYDLREPVAITNFLLQHKIGKAGLSLARMAINTTLGIGGLFDVAKRKPFHIPYRRNGFGNTLGFYGVPPGPYMFLPIIGSTTLRDLIGTVADRSFLPAAVGGPFKSPIYGTPVIVLGTLDDRLVNDERIRRERMDSGNPYLAARDAYLASRKAEIEALRHPNR